VSPASVPASDPLAQRSSVPQKLEQLGYTTARAEMPAQTLKPAPDSPPDGEETPFNSTDSKTLANRLNQAKLTVLLTVWG